MPFIIRLNADDSYKITNANTGRVYAYATNKPDQVMAIVERYGHGVDKVLEKAQRQKSRKK